LPQLYAATEGVHGGKHFGPDGPDEMRGHHPKLVQFFPAPAILPGPSDED
jgi:hypothetical protein